MKRHSETHINKNNMIKQSKRFSGDMKPEHKKTTTGSQNYMTNGNKVDVAARIALCFDKYWCVLRRNSLLKCERGEVFGIGEAVVVVFKAQKSTCFQIITFLLYYETRRQVKMATTMKYFIRNQI